MNNANNGFKNIFRFDDDAEAPVLIGFAQAKKADESLAITLRAGLLRDFPPAIYYTSPASVYF